MHGLNLTCGIASTKREILHGKPVVEYLVEDHDLIRVPSTFVCWSSTFRHDVFRKSVKGPLEASSIESNNTIESSQMMASPLRLVPEVVMCSSGIVNIIRNVHVPPVCL